MQFMTLLNSEMTSLMTFRKTEDFVDSYEDILKFKGVKVYAEAKSNHARIFEVKCAWSSSR